MIEANHLPNLCAYWWGPGPNAADALASMPAPRGLTVGDRVRYRRTFLRSIGCANDPDMLDWRGVVLSLPHLSRATRLAECEQPPVECHCGLGKPEVDGCAAAEPDCYRCGGSGVARRTRVNVRNLECVK